MFVLFIFPVFIYAQTLDEKLKEIDAYAEKAPTDWNVPGMAITIVKDDKIVFAKGFGIRKLGNPEKVDKNTLFAITNKVVLTGLKGIDRGKTDIFREFITFDTSIPVNFLF